MFQSQVLLIATVVVLGVSSAPSSSRPRNRRSLGLVKLGYDKILGSDFLSGVASGVGSSFGELSTGSQVLNTLAIAKPIALGLIGKCK